MMPSQCLCPRRARDPRIGYARILHRSGRGCTNNPALLPIDGEGLARDGILLLFLFGLQTAPRPRPGPIIGRVTLGVPGPGLAAIIS